MKKEVTDRNDNLKDREYIVGKTKVVLTPVFKSSGTRTLSDVFIYLIKHK